MKTKMIAIFASAVLLAVPGLASAQLGGLGKALGGGSGGGSISANQIVTNYVDGAKYVNSADIKMLRAVGLKDEADRLELQSKNLTAGATKDSLEEANKAQTDSSKALESRLNGEKFTMDEASKAQFSDGMADLGKGLIKYITLAKNAQGFKPSPSDLGAASSATYVASSLPDSIKALASSLKSSTDFAKTNNIPVPKESVEATSML